MNELGVQRECEPQRRDVSRVEELRVIPSSALFPAEARRVVIRHNGRDYLLLETKQGKLLLNLR